MASLVKRPDSSFWFIQWSENGTLKRRSTKCRDRKLAEIALKDFELNRERRLVGLPVDSTFKQFLNWFIESKENEKSPESFRKDALFCRTLERRLNIHSIKELTEDKCRKVINELKKEGKKANTINHYLRCLRMIGEYAVSKNFLLINPAKGIKRARKVKNPPRYLTKQEAAAILKASKSSWLYPVIITAIYSGMRINELITLDWKDIDLKREIITVQGQKSKSRRFRQIPIHPKIKPLLATITPQIGPVFRHTKGPILSPPQKEWKRVLKLSGVTFQKNERFHVLRHTFAAWAIMGGVDVYTLAKLMGHSSVSITDMYGHISPEFAKDAIKKVGN